MGLALGLSASCIDFDGLDTGGVDGAVVDLSEAGADAIPGTPCEAGVVDDPTNCGACGHVCPTRLNSIPACVNGQCGITCDTNFGNCDNQPDNGCETVLGSDPKNCGACGRDCAGGACNVGQCAPVVLASNQSSPNVLVLDQGSVYWAAYYSYTIDKVGKDGGTPTTLSQAEVYPSGVAVDGTAIYWASRGYGSSDGFVRRAPLAGGGPVTIVGGLSTRPSAVAVDANKVYYATLGDFSATGGAIASAPLGAADAGAGTALAPQQNNPMFLTIDANAIYWSNNGTFVAPDAGAPNGSIVKCATPACAGGPQTIASAQNHPRGIAVDTDTIYWTNFGANQNDGAIMKCPKAGCGTGATVLASNLVYPDGIAVDAKYVYFTSHGSQLYRLPLAGGAPEVLATIQQSYPLGIAVDDKFIYFSTYSGPSGGTIQKLLK
jgi:hypothetical protein